MWKHCFVRLGHRVAKDTYKRQVYLSSETADALKHVRKLGLHSLPNVTKADIAETFSLIKNNIDRQTASITVHAGCVFTRP